MIRKTDDGLQKKAIDQEKPKFAKLQLHSIDISLSRLPGNSGGSRITLALPKRGRLTAKCPL